MTTQVSLIRLEPGSEFTLPLIGLRGILLSKNESEAKVRISRPDSNRTELGYWSLNSVVCYHPDGSHFAVTVLGRATEVFLEWAGSEGWEPLEALKVLKKLNLCDLPAEEDVEDSVNKGWKNRKKRKSPFSDAEEEQLYALYSQIAK